MRGNDVTDLHRTEVDGVPAFWVDSGRPTLTAALVFRCGMVDETLPQTGWTHLLEHLALHGRGGGALQVNGMVSLLHTRFDAHGPSEAVARTLSDTAAWLAHPDLREFTRERGVLRAESALRSVGEIGPALVWRYGARGPGLAGYLEPGLSRATVAAIASLAAASFTRGNAALFLDGPPPAGLRLPLADGPARPTPVAVPCEEELPAAYLIRAGATVSGVVERTVQGTVLPHVLREQFTRQFRHRDGAAYAPWSHYEPVDDHHAVVLCGTDASDDLLKKLADRVLEQVEQVAAGHVDESVVAGVVAQLEQFHLDPFNSPTLAYRAVVDHLRGEPVDEFEEILAEIRAVDVDAVAQAGTTLRDSLLLGIADRATWRRQLPFPTMPSLPEPLASRPIRSRDFPAVRQRLVVTGDAVQMGADDHWSTVRASEIVGVFAQPDGARELVSRDGWTLRVEPTLWRGGSTLTERLDRLVDPDLLIPAERGADQVPHPQPLWRRLEHVARGSSPRERWRVVYTLLVLVLAVLAITLGAGPFPYVALAIGLGSTWWRWAQDRQQAKPARRDRAPTAR